MDKPHQCLLLLLVLPFFLSNEFWYYVCPMFPKSGTIFTAINGFWFFDKKRHRIAEIKIIQRPKCFSCHGVCVTWDAKSGATLLCTNFCSNTVSVKANLKKLFLHQEEESDHFCCPSRSFLMKLLLLNVRRFFQLLATTETLDRLSHFHFRIQCCCRCSTS